MQKINCIMAENSNILLNRLFFSEELNFPNCEFIYSATPIFTKIPNIVANVKSREYTPYCSTLKTLVRKNIEKKPII